MKSTNTIVSTLKDLESGSTTSQKLVEACLAQIKATESGNAYISTLEEKAVEQAALSDKKRAEGKASSLEGLPMAFKDNMAIENTKTTCGSKMLENFVSPYTGTAVQNLLDQGVIAVGKANMDEFAMGSTSESSFFGVTENPAAPDRIPGGSSGGSAAAVANGSVVASLGSDTGGSIRQPAACCGVVGLKPTYGRVSRFGLVAYASSLDQIGPLANSVEDCAILLNHIGGFDPKDNTSVDIAKPDFTSLLTQDIKGKVVGLPKEYFSDKVHLSQRDTVKAAVEALEAQGAILKEVSIPSLEYAVASYYILAMAEASTNLSRFDGVRYTHRTSQPKDLAELYSKSRSEGFGAEVRKRILMGTYVLSSGHYDAYYVKAQKVRQILKNEFEAALKECDILAGPNLPNAPMKLGDAAKDPMEMYLSDIFTVSINMVGLPAISLPCGVVDGLPVGIQLIGRSFGEAELLQMASAVERLA